MSSTHAHTTGDKIGVEATDNRGDDIGELICEKGSIVSLALLDWYPLATNAGNSMNGSTCATLNIPTTNKLPNAIRFSNQTIIQH